MPRKVLLMTATITPAANSTALRVQDPEDRRRQYQQALSFYAESLRGHVDGIVLAENSGADLAPMKAFVPSGFLFEPVSTPPTESGGLIGRGYGETVLVAHAFERSALLHDAVAVKVTGRYRVLNLKRVMRAMDFEADCGFNTRTIPSTWVDLAVYFANRNAMAALHERADALMEGPSHIPAERLMPSVLDEMRAAGVQIQRRFGSEPRVRGVRGWDGRAYGDARQSAKWLARSVAKRVAPAIWI